MTADNVNPLIAPNESLYEFITRRALAASDRQLAVLSTAAAISGIALAAMVPRLWPFAAICGTLFTIAAWGLLEHRRPELQTQWLTITERLLVTAGCLLAFLAMMGTLYLLLGSGWIS